MLPERTFGPRADEIRQRASWARQATLWPPPTARGGRLTVFANDIP